MKKMHNEIGTGSANGTSRISLMQASCGSLFVFSHLKHKKIGAARFELATSRPPAVRATKLRHTP